MFTSITTKTGGYKTTAGAAAVHSLANLAASSTPSNSNQVAVSVQTAVNAITSTPTTSETQPAIAAVTALAQQSATSQPGDPTQVVNAAQTATGGM